MNDIYLVIYYPEENEIKILNPYEVILELPKLLKNKYAFTLGEL